MPWLLSPEADDPALAVTDLAVDDDDTLRIAVAPGFALLARPFAICAMTPARLHGSHGRRECLPIADLSAASVAGWQHGPTNALTDAVNYDGS